jgi:hypothetical protein
LRAEIGRAGTVKPLTARKIGYNAVMKYQFSLWRLFLWLTAICVICAFPMFAAMLGVVALVIVIPLVVGIAAVGFSFLLAFVGVLLVTLRSRCTRQP